MLEPWGMAEASALGFKVPLERLSRSNDSLILW